MISPQYAAHDEYLMVFLWAKFGWNFGCYMLVVFCHSRRAIGPLCEKMTSSTKPEVHNISQRHKRRIEPRPQAGNVHNKFGEVVFTGTRKWRLHPPLVSGPVSSIPWQIDWLIDSLIEVRPCGFRVIPVDRQTNSQTNRQSHVRENVCSK